VLVERLGRDDDNAWVRKGKATHRNRDRHAIDSITAISPNIEQKKAIEITLNSGVRLT
jgi:hypothetical protein